MLNKIGFGSYGKVSLTKAIQMLKMTFNNHQRAHKNSFLHKNLEQTKTTQPLLKLFNQDVLKAILIRGIKKLKINNNQKKLKNNFSCTK